MADSLDVSTITWVRALIASLGLAYAVTMLHRQSRARKRRSNGEIIKPDESRRLHDERRQLIALAVTGSAGGLIMAVGWLRGPDWLLIPLAAVAIAGLVSLFALLLAGLVRDVRSYWF